MVPIKYLKSGEWTAQRSSCGTCDFGARCSVAFNCPHGYTPFPDTYCDGVVCDATRDAGRFFLAVCSSKLFFPCRGPRCPRLQEPVNHDSQRRMIKNDCLNLSQDRDICCRPAMPCTAPRMKEVGVCTLL